MEDKKKKVDYELVVTNDQRNLIDEAVEGHLDERNARRFLCAVLKGTSYARAMYQQGRADQLAHLPDVGIGSQAFRQSTGYRGSVAGMQSAGIFEELPVRKSKFHVSPQAADEYQKARTAEYRMEHEWYIQYLRAGLNTTSTTRYKAYTPDKEQTSSVYAKASDVSNASEYQRQWIRDVEGHHEYDTSVVDDLRDRLLKRLDKGVEVQHAAYISHLILAVRQLQEQTTEQGLRVTYKADARHGRIYTRRMIQGLCAPIKAKVFADTTTYDWASCHKDLSVILADMLGVDLPPEPDKDGLDVNRKMAKIASHGVRYGGTIPVSLDQMEMLARRSSASIAASLQAIGATQQDLDVLKNAYGGLESAMQDLKKAAKDVIDELEHPMGCEYDHPTEEEKEEKEKGKEGQNALAYYLQGMEALLTSTLCKHIDVALADHDGIETTEDAEVVQYAAAKAVDALQEWAGKKLAVTPRLAEKALAKQKDFDKLDALLDADVEKELTPEELDARGFHAEAARRRQKQQKSPSAAAEPKTLASDYPDLPVKPSRKKRGVVRAYAEYLAQADYVVERVVGTDYVIDVLFEIQQAAREVTRASEATATDWIELQLTIASILEEVEREEIAVSRIRSALSAESAYKDLAVTTASHRDWLTSTGRFIRRWEADRSALEYAREHCSTPEPVLA